MLRIQPHFSQKATTILRNGAGHYQLFKFPVAKKASCTWSRITNGKNDVNRTSAEKHTQWGAFSKNVKGPIRTKHGTWRSFRSNGNIGSSNTIFKKSSCFSFHIHRIKTPLAKIYLGRIQHSWRKATRAITQRAVLIFSRNNYVVCINLRFTIRSTKWFAAALDINVGSGFIRLFYLKYWKENLIKSLKW